MSGGLIIFQEGRDLGGAGAAPRRKYLTGVVYLPNGETRGGWSSSHARAAVFTDRARAERALRGVWMPGVGVEPEIATVAPRDPAARRGVIIDGGQPVDG